MRAISSKIAGGFLAAAVLALFTAGPAGAFVPGAPQGATTTTLNFFGTPFTCNSHGVPVVFVFNYYLNDVGNTNYYTTPTVITVNPDYVMRLAQIDPHTAIFALGHECGHARLLTPVEENADCWSASVGVLQGWFGPADLPAMWAEFQNNPGDWSHPPGPVRVAHIAQCVQAAQSGSPLVPL